MTPYSFGLATSTKKTQLPNKVIVLKNKNKGFSLIKKGTPRFNTHHWLEGAPYKSVGTLHKIILAYHQKIVQQTLKKKYGIFLQRPRLIALT